MKKIKEIEIIRGVLILIIVFFHYTYRFTELFKIETINFFSLNNWGIIGVGCFFIITGYFIVPKKMENYDIRKFITKKILRIYPSYALCVTIIFISIKLFGLEGRETNFIDYLLNLTLINGIIDTKYIDGAHWYITYLITFYIIVGLILKLTKKSEIYVIIWLIIKDIVKIVTKFIPNSLIIYRLIGGDYVEFIVIGIVLNSIIKIKEEDMCNIYNLLKMKLIHWYFLIIMISLFQIAITRGIIVIIGIMIFLMILLILLFKEQKEILILTPLYYIGDMSFVLYLIHQNIGYQILLKLYNLGFGFKFIYVIITLLIILFISYIIDRLFEKRVQRIIREKLKKGAN